MTNPSRGTVSRVLRASCAALALAAASAGCADLRRDLAHLRAVSTAVTEAYGYTEAKLSGERITLYVVDSPLAALDDEAREETAREIAALAARTWRGTPPYSIHVEFPTTQASGSVTVTRAPAPHVFRWRDVAPADASPARAPTRTDRGTISRNAPAITAYGDGAGGTAVALPGGPHGNKDASEGRRDHPGGGDAR